MIETEVRMVIWPQKRCSNHYKLWGASKGSAGLRKTFVCLSFINVFGEPKTHFGDLHFQTDRERDTGLRVAGRPATAAAAAAAGGRRPAGRASAVRGQVSADMTWKSIPFRTNARPRLPFFSPSPQYNIYKK